MATNRFSGDWALALGTATASGTWEGFRLSPVRPTAELRVDGALEVGEVDREHYAIVVDTGYGRERVLVAGNGGTVEFGHDLVELLHLEPAGGTLAAMWLTDLSTGLESDRCALPRFAAYHPR
jgi:hypothetical protein